MTAMLTILAAVLAANDGHEAINPVYHELRNVGVVVAASVKVPLPAPLMADGLSAAAQTKLLTDLIKDDYDYEEFTRESQVAPFLLRIADAKGSDPKNPVKRIEVYFVAYGDADRFQDKKFLERLGQGGGKNDRGRDITPAELAKHGVKLTDPEHEGYGRTTVAMFDLVELSVTGRSFWSRTPGSLLAATRLDERFAADPELASVWRPLTRDDGGELKAGEPHPYTGTGHYLKVTPLREPRGAMFVEMHAVFVEPHGWFNGQNLLRSKLPPVVQRQVRKVRFELAK